MNSIIHTPTNKLENSLDFYSKLGFKNLSKEAPYIVSDGKAFIEINPLRFARAGVKLFRNDWSEEISQIQKLTPVIAIDGGHLCSAPSGTWIYLMKGDSPIAEQAQENSFSKLGNFAGLSLETISIAQSVAIWEILGFHKTMGEVEQGWVLYQNAEDFGISFMKPNSCPHLFFNPSMTYFNGKNNLNVIDQIRQLEIPITEEITHFNKEGIVDNIIIRDPGGYGFFLFSD